MERSRGLRIASNRTRSATDFQGSTAEGGRPEVESRVGGFNGCSTWCALAYSDHAPATADKCRRVERSPWPRMRALEAFARRPPRKSIPRRPTSALPGAWIPRKGPQAERRRPPPVTPSCDPIPRPHPSSSFQGEARTPYPAGTPRNHPEVRPPLPLPAQIRIHASMSEPNPVAGGHATAHRIDRTDDRYPRCRTRVGERTHDRRAKPAHHAPRMIDRSRSFSEARHRCQRQPCRSRRGLDVVIDHSLPVAAER